MATVSDEKTPSSSSSKAATAAGNGATHRLIPVDVNGLSWVTKKTTSALEKAAAYFARDKILMAAETLDGVKVELSGIAAAASSSSSSSSPSSTSTTESPKAVAEGMWKELVAKNSWIDDVGRDVSDISKLYDLLDEEKDNNWVEVANSDGIRTFYRKEAGNDIHSIKVHGELFTSLPNLCAVMNECDLIPTILTLISMDVRMVKQISPFMQLIYVSAGLPWPFDNRDAVFTGRGVDMLERGSVVVLAHPGPDTPEDWKAEYPDVQSAMSVPVQPPTPTSTSSTSTSSSTSSSNVPMKDISVHMPPSGTTRMRLAFCGGVLRAVTPNLTLVSAIFNVDPRLAVVPSTLINFMTRSMAHYGFEMLRSQMLKFKDSPFAKRMEAKPWFYDDIRARIDDMWAARAVLSPTSASASPPPATAAVAAVAAANTASSGGTLADSAPSANGERTEEKKSSDESTAASSSSSSSSPLIPLTVPALAPALQMPLSPEDLIFGTAVLGHKIFGRAPPTSSSSSSSASSSGSDAQAKTSGGSMFVKGGGGESGTAYYALRMRDPHLLFVGSCDVLTEGRFMGSSWRDVYLFVRDDGVYIANEDAAEKFLDEVASSPVSLPSSVAAKDSSPASTAAAATTPAVTVCPNVEKFYASLRASDPKKRTVSHFIPATTIFSLGASNSSSSSSTSPDASLSSLELVPSLTYTVGAYVSTDDSQVMNVYLGRGVEAFDATVQDTTGYPSYKEASGSAPLLTAESIKARVSSSSSPGSSPVSAFVGGRRVQIRLRSDGHTHLAVWAFNEFASRWTTATSSMAAANASSPTAATASSTPK